MTIATVDIGTNTLLLLIAEVRHGEIIPLRTEERIPRLGAGVDAEHRLSPEGMNRALLVLEEYRSIIQQHAPAAVVSCGTSALRDAENREEFIRLAASRGNFNVEVLSGEDEALWTFRGAVGGRADSRRAAVIDIGGGSTEITVGRGSQIETRMSAQVGAVRLTERFFRSDPPGETDIRLAEEEVARAFPSPAVLAGDRIIGVAGTVVTLASLAEERPEGTDGLAVPKSLSRKTVDRLFDRLRVLPSSAIRILSPLMEGRADVITAGALILREVMHRFGVAEIGVSERGLRYGLVWREMEQRR